MKSFLMLPLFSSAQGNGGTVDTEEMVVPSQELSQDVSQGLMFYES